MIIVIGSATAISGREDAVRALSLSHVQRSRLEPGCLAHNVSVDSESPSRFVFVEYWSDMPALMAHFALESSQEFVRQLKPLLSADPTMKIFDSQQVQPETP